MSCRVGSTSDDHIDGPSTSPSRTNSHAQIDTISPPAATVPIVGSGVASITPIEDPPPYEHTNIPAKVEVESKEEVTPTETRVSVAVTVETSVSPVPKV